MGTVPASVEEYYGPQPKYDYTWKGIPFLRGEFFKFAELASISIHLLKGLTSVLKLI